MDSAQSARPAVAPSILVVADSVAQGEPVVIALQAPTRSVALVCDEASAMAVVRERVPRLVVLVEPLRGGVDGPALCRRLQSDPRARETTVLLLARLDAVGMVSRALECEAQHFLAVPCSDAILCQHVDDILRADQQHASHIAERVSTRDFERHRHALDDSRSQMLDALVAAYAGQQAADAAAHALRQQVATQSAETHLLDAIFEHIPDMLFIKDCEDLRYLRINPAGERLLGLSRQDVVGRSAEDIFQPAQAAHHTATDREAVISGRLVEIDVEPLLRRDGSRRILHTRKTVLRDTDGKPRYLLGISKDITDRQQASQTLLDAKHQLELANQELARREEEIRSVVDFMADCVITIDQFGVIQAANNVMLSVFGWSPSEVVGRNVSLLMPEPTRGHHDGYLERYLNGGEPGVIGKRRMVEGLRRDGSRVMVELAVSEYQVHGKRFYTGIVRDVGERVRMLNELDVARIEAERANRAKSEFLATMSHEIRTPMNGVIGMVEVLQQSSLKSYQMEMVNLIRDSAFSLLTIIDRILDFSKLEAGALEVEHAPMSVGEVIESACGMLDHLAVKKSVDLTFFVDPAIPTPVLGDALRVRQVLINLIGNAIKFSSEHGGRGEVAVRAELVARRGDEVTVELRVMDNGIGMDAETQARLFAPFSQADASTTRRFGGTGLGLAISYRLVSLMKGAIKVDSRAGSGSTFTVSLSFDVADATVKTHHTPSDVHDLPCLVIGAEHGMSADLIRYLAAADARVARLTDMERFTSLAALGLDASHEPLVCVVDAGHGAVTPLELLASLQSRLGVALRLVMVLVERGKRRQLRQLANNLVVVDGNVLSGATLLRAVAVASGRAAMAEEQSLAGRNERALRAPTREQALRDGRLILVAEDNDINQKVILRQLALLGATADIAVNGREALECWRSQDYALLLTDVHMPEMDGYDLTRAIRAAEGGAARRPIIALTANALKFEVDACREAGMDDYLSKPATLEALRTMLEKWLPPLPATAAMHSGESGAGAAIDTDALVALVGNDQELIAGLLGEFRSSARAEVALICAACKRADHAESCLVAHKLKSAARAIGANHLADLCAELERDGGTADADTLATFAMRMMSEFNRVDAMLVKHLASMHDSLRAGP